MRLPALRAPLATAFAAGALDTAFVLVRPGLPRAPVALALALLGAFSGAALLAHLCGALVTVVVRVVLTLPSRARAACFALAAVVVGALVSVAAFSGSGVRRSGLTPALTAATLMTALTVAVLLARRVPSLFRPAPPRGALALAAPPVFALCAYLAHALVYPRQYALLHALVAFAALALPVAPLRRPVRAHPQLVLVALIALAALGARDASRAHVRRAAPLAQFTLSALGPVYRLLRPAPPAQLAARATQSGPSLALRGADLVLLTVDALRADRLGAYGSTAALTPALDALAREGVVLERAYCTTPHTSYSLASLVTGKYFREVSALGASPRAHDTLASRLRAHGYQTAAFFPPAVFFVDADRLGALRTGGFDFEERRDEYATAEQRAQQVEALLARTPRDRPLLLWVHFFEPHEPYEPHGSLRPDAPPRARYDSEVTAVDTAIASIRASFVRHGRRAAWVVTADHGEEFGEHGGRFHGTTLFDEQLRVPLLVSAPGLAPRRVAGPASLVDVLPTLLAGAGVPFDGRLRGHDLGPWLLGARTDPAGPVFASVGALRMVTDGAHKLICDAGDGSCELYALVDDPHERTNVIDQRPAESARLRSLLEGWGGSHGGFERSAAASSPDAEPPPPACLERALQGERAVARELAGALPSLRGATLRRAVEALASLGDEDPSVRDPLAVVAARASDPATARAASVALARLGDPRGLARARVSLAASDPRESHAAALGLARLEDAAGWARLEASARDASEPEQHRDAAVAALESLSPRLRDRARSLWSSLLTDPRLGPRAARALGALHDEASVPALRDALGVTPYALTRQALLEALAPLDAPSARAALARALAAPEGLPDPLPLLRALAEPGTTLRGTPPSDSPPPPQRRRTLALRGPAFRGHAVAYLYWERAPGAADAATLTLEGTVVPLEDAHGWARVELARARSSLRVRATEPLRFGPAVLVSAQR